MPLFTALFVRQVVSFTEVVLTRIPLDVRTSRDTVPDEIRSVRLTDRVFFEETVILYHLLNSYPRKNTDVTFLPALSAVAFDLQ